MKGMMCMSNKAKIREDALNLNPIDDVLFCKMAEDIFFCEEILKVILSDYKLKVFTNVPQFTAKNMQGRSCILDLKCQLGDGRLVNIEIQRADDDDHQKRILYNAALLITNTSNPGEKFKNVPDVIMIFISAFDVFKQGKTLYHIDRVIRETSTKASNGMEEIYINTVIDDKSDVADLMKVFTENDTYNDVKFPVTSNIKRRFKTTEEGVNEMCEIIERNRAEGRAEGKAEAETTSIIKLLKKNKTIDEIVDLLDFTKERVLDVAKANGLAIS